MPKKVKELHTINKAATSVNYLTIQLEDEFPGIWDGWKNLVAVPNRPLKDFIDFTNLYFTSIKGDHKGGTIKFFFVIIHMKPIIHNHKQHIRVKIKLKQSPFPLSEKQTTILKEFIVGGDDPEEGSVTVTLNTGTPSTITGDAEFVDD
jgi:hypothetical protein